MSQPTRHFPFVLLKGGQGHDVSGEPRDKDGKWTKTPGSGLNAAEKKKQAFLQRVSEDPRRGDAVLVNDPSMSDYGDKYIVTRGRKKNDPDEENYIFIRKSYWPEKNASRVYINTWKDFLADGRLKPYWPTDSFPTTTPTQWKELRKSCTKKAVQELKNDLLLAFQWHNDESLLAERVLNLLCTKPPTDFSFQLTHAVPGIEQVDPAKTWTVTTPPKSASPKSKIILTSGNEHITLTGEQWLHVARSGEMPFTVKSVAALLPSMCATCGKEIKGKETHQCPYCGQDFCGDDIAAHMKDCPEKGTCAVCGVEKKNTELDTCPFCGKTFCSKHSDPKVHNCPELAYCDKCGAMKAKKTLTTDPFNPDKHYCTHCAEEVIGVSDQDGDGKVGTWDVTHNYGIAEKTKDAIVHTIADKLRTSDAFKELVRNENLTTYRYANDRFTNTVDTLIHAWAVTSCDSNYTSVALQKAAAQEFNLQDYENTWDNKNNYWADNSEVSKESDAMLARSGPGLRAFLAAVYDNTQKYLHAKGIKNITLYRGFSYDKKGLQNDLTDKLEYDRDNYEEKPGQYDAQVRLQPLSSFSTSARVARGFNGDTGIPVVIKVRVPVESVFSTAITGTGCLNEEEMVVLGDRIFPCKVGVTSAWEGAHADSGADVWIDALKNKQTTTKSLSETQLFSTVLPDQQQKQAHGPILSVDAKLSNADWIKQGWDLPEYGDKQFFNLLRGLRMGLDHFRSLPVFRQKQQQKSLTAARPLLLLAKSAAHDVSQEPRDKDGKWTKSPGSGETKDTTETLTGAQFLQQVIPHGGAGETKEEYIKRIADNPKEGDIVLMSDSGDLPWNPNAGMVMRVAKTPDMTKYSPSITLTPPYVFPPAKEELTSKHDDMSMGKFTWQHKFEYKQLIPLWGDELPPPPTDTQVASLAVKTDNMTLANIAYRAANFIQNSGFKVNENPETLQSLLRTYIYWNDDVRNTLLAAMVARPLKGFEFPGQNGERWTVTSETPKKFSLDNTITITSSKGRTVSFSGLQWWQLCQTGFVPKTETSAVHMLELLPTKCSKCGKEFPAKDLKACEYCKSLFCKDCLPEHEKTCSQKVMCSMPDCDHAEGKEYMPTCPACNKQFCPEHIAMEAHHCSNGVQCASCKHLFQKDQLTKDPKTGKKICAACMKRKYKVHDLNGNGAIDADDVVESEEIRANTKDKIVQNFYKKLSTNADFIALAKDIKAKGENADERYGDTVKDAIDTLIHTWAETACDSHPTAIALQMAAADEFGLQGYEPSWESHSGGSMAAAHASTLNKQWGKAYRAFLRTMYDDTQAYFQKNHRKKVTLYRGFSYSFSGLETSRAHELRAGVAPIIKANAVLQPMSSFSTSQRIAREFNGDNGANLMMKMSVPVEDVIGTALTGFGCLNEKEMVVLGRHPMPCTVGPVERWPYSGGGQLDKLWMDALPEKKHYHNNNNDDDNYAYDGYDNVAIEKSDTIPVVYPDRDITNADWTKRTWDLPAYGTSAFQNLLRRSGMSLAHFKKLPIYQYLLLKKKKTVQKSHDVSEEARDTQGRWTREDFIGKWGADTAYKSDIWTADCPEKGQCAVTALAVQKKYGGDIIRAKVGRESHYYNRLPDGSEIDLTRGQFPQNAPVKVLKIADRKQLLSNEGVRTRYETLWGRIASIDTVAKSQPPVKRPGSRGGHGYWNEQGQWVYGERPAISQAKSRANFKNWFGQSVITKTGKPGGKPLVVYHGTAASFSTFRPSQGSFGVGIYFASDPQDANSYAEMKEGSQNVIPAYVKITNPLVLPASASKWPQEYQGMWGNDAYKLTELAQQQGHDGIIIRGAGNNGGDYYVVFQPQNIKSALGNDGSYSTSGDIGKSHDVSGEPRNPKGEWTKDNHHGNMAGKREFDPNAPYWVYLNLHMGTKKPLVSKKTGKPILNTKGKPIMVPDQKVWSLKNWNTGLVDRHMDTVYLKDVRMHIGQAGRRKVIETGVKNVHAGVVGKVIVPEEAPAEGWQELHYNPKDHPELKNGFFMLADPNRHDQRISHAKYVRFTPQGTQVWSPTYKKSPHDDDLYMNNEAQGARAVEVVEHIAQQVTPEKVAKSILVLAKGHDVSDEPRDERGRWIKLAQNELAGMAADAKKYKDFHEYSIDWSVMGMRGQYWHLTSKKNFKIDSKYVPHEYSSMADDSEGDGRSGLMVSGDPEWWHQQLPKGRRWAAEIDLSHAKRNRDYNVTNRGFGAEVFINNPAAVSVKRIVPYHQAVQEAQHYADIGPQSEDDLRNFWTAVHKTTVPATKSILPLVLFSKSTRDVSDEPRDERGRWTKEAGSSVQDDGWPEGLPRDIKFTPGETLIPELISGGHFHITAHKRPIQWYPDHDYVLRVQPRLRKYHQPVPEWHNDEPTRRWYDTRLAHVEKDDWGDGFGSYHTMVNDNLPPDYSTELPVKQEPGKVWRGLSWEEMQDIKNTGMVHSHGTYNIGDVQNGLTYFADNPDMAESYAGNFAPPANMATFDRPAYMIKVADPGENGAVRLPHIPGEVGLKGPIPASKIEEIYELQPFEVHVGEYDLMTDHGLPEATFSQGSSQKPGAAFVYRRITDIPDFLKGKKVTKSSKPVLLLKAAHDVSQEPRDEDGKWSKEGAVANKRTVADVTENPRVGDVVDRGKQGTVTVIGFGKDDKKRRGIKVRLVMPHMPSMVTTISHDGWRGYCGVGPEAEFSGKGTVIPTQDDLPSFIPPRAPIKKTIPRKPDALAPQGNPVSAALTLPKSASADPLRAALTAIDDVHGDGILPVIPVALSSAKVRDGGYYMKNNQPVKISISRNADSMPLSLVHEIGHFIDQQGIGKGKFASENLAAAPPALARWHDAVTKSKSFLSLQALGRKAGVDVIGPDGTSRWYPLDRKYVRYLCSPSELFARSYAQYIATKSGNHDLIMGLNSERKSLNAQLDYPRHWDDNDFVPIAASFDELFKELGWVK